METTYHNLHLCQLTPEMHSRTCGYWFTVTTDYSTAHTAFRTREELEKWLEERALSLTAPLAEHGEHSWQPLKGAYKRASFMSYNTFYALPAIRQTRITDNGRDTLCLITEDADGVRTVNHLNCNCKFRIEYDWRTGAAMTANDYDLMAYGYRR